MPYSLEDLERALLERLAKKGEPVGWYFLEHSLNIPRGEFPLNCNVMTILSSLKEKGLISELGHEGRARYQITDEGSAVAKGTKV